jgi:hypothetical protein
MCGDELWLIHEKKGVNGRYGPKVNAPHKFYCILPIILTSAEQFHKFNMPNALTLPPTAALTSSALKANRR